jgi:undecaprenyl-diphosphatase
VNIINAIILGAIQGLTEFLPVSSSGHLVLFQKFLDVSESALLFDTMLHVGTLAAVCTVLRKDIWAVLRKLNQPLTVYLIIATVPAVVFALVCKKPLERAFETGHYLGFAFLATSALLAAAELLAKRAARASKSGDLKNPGEMNWLDALAIGLLQAIAVIPGVSRSGATLSGALSRGLDRDFAARFSFLLSIPAILGAAVLQIRDLARGGIAAAGGGMGSVALIAGTLSAATVGFFAVRLMLKIVREKTLWGFAVYTGVLGLLVLLDQFVAHLVF